MSEQKLDDSIYLELDSVWKRGDDWRRYVGKCSLGSAYDTFNRKDYGTCSTPDWLAWAKHPDTVLVYSPNRNKLPVKPGWVRKRAAIAIDADGNAFTGKGYSLVGTFSPEYTDPNHSKIFLEFDVRLPVLPKPETVEGTVTE